MATHILRKHRKGIMIAIIVPLSAAFVYWGTPLGSGSGGAPPVNTIATAAGVDITVDQYMQALNEERSRQSQSGQQMTIGQIFQNGTARTVLQNLIDRELLRAAADQSGYTFDREFLTDRLKDDPYFQNDDGSFNADRWNELVDNGVNGGWEVQYARISSDLRYALFLQTVLASARVFEPEIREDFKKQFELQETRVTLKQAAIEPEVVPTEEEIRARYDEDPSLYEKPEERSIEFVSWSLQPPVPEEAGTIVQRARGGEAFETLVEEFSQGPFKDAGGDLGWITRAITTPEHQLALFDMEEGSVSDPIQGPRGYFIFKLEEKRESEVTGALDVRARQILLSPVLDAADREAYTAEAEALAEAVADGGNFEESAYEVHTAGPISIDTQSVDNIKNVDFFTVRGAVLPLGEGDYSGVIMGSRNLYVARVLNVKPAAPSPFEDVRDEVAEDTKNIMLRSPENVAARNELAIEIGENVSSFDELRKQYPGLPIEVKVLPEFSAVDYDFQSGPLWQAVTVIQALADAELGDLVGPINDFMGAPHFVELVARTTPEEGAWETEWETQKESVLLSQQFGLQQERLEDYLTHLRNQGNWTLDDAIFAQLMAASVPATPATPAASDSFELPPLELGAPDAPATDAPSDAPGA
jgi:hypothetical protein